MAGLESSQLLIDGHAARVMQRRDGWLESFVPGIGAGTRYGYRLESGLQIPDPASRFQPDDCTGKSMVVDTGAYPGVISTVAGNIERLEGRVGIENWRPRFPGSLPPRGKHVVTQVEVEVTDVVDDYDFSARVISVIDAPVVELRAASRELPLATIGSFGR